MATSGNKQQRSSLNGSVQASDLRENPSHVINGVTVMVGENREHFSLLHGNRRQRHQQYYDRAVRAVPSVVAGSEPTSGNEDEEVQNDSEGLLMLNLKVLVKNRMSGYRHLMCSRRPKGKGVLLVLTIVLLESFAFIGALTGIRRLLPVNDCHKCRTDWESFMLSLLSSSVGRVFYPIAGVIADSYLGRYSVIHIGLWLLWIGFAVSAFSLGVQLLIPAGSVAGKVCECVVAVIAVVLFGAGSGSVEATLIPFGVDQLAQGAPSDELSSYFHYYYIARNIGGLIATLVLFVVFDEISFFPHPVDSPTSKASKFNVEIKYILQNLLAILAVTLALLIVLYCRKQFYRDKQHSNALKSVTRVSCYAARVKRQLPQRNRAFRYGGALTPRIDLAKEENDGTFSGEEVEEVKTFYRMLLLILSLFGYFITYGAGFAYMTSTMSIASANVIPLQHGHALHYLANNVIWIINTGSISIALPIINHLLIPIRPTFNIRLNLSIGFLLHVLSFGAAALIQSKQEQLNDSQFFCLMVVAVVLLSVGETIVFVSSLEFIYAQSPNNMKGLQTGMFYLIFGVFSAVGSSVYLGYLNHISYTSPSSVATSWSNFCVILVSIGTVGLVVYIVVAFCYKNRQRPATDEADAQRRLLYANVYGSKS